MDFRQMGFYPDFQLKCSLHGSNVKSVEICRWLEKSNRKGKTNGEISVFAVSSSFFNKIPRIAAKVFINIQVLYFYECKIDEIFRHQIEDFKHLKELWMMRNNISHLPEDLFEATPEIEKISFESNQISSVGIGLLDRMRSLKFCDFRGNPRIDVIFDESSDDDVSLDYLKET